MAAEWQTPALRDANRRDGADHEDWPRLRCDTHPRRFAQIAGGNANGMGAGRQKAYNCVVFTQTDPHDVEVAMKYVLLGNLSPEYASKQSERVKKAKAKLDKLGIKIESIHYTQGYYDFVDIVDAPNPEAMLAFSVWYSTQRLGRIQSMPAFDAKSFETAIKNATD
jgi:uncharacterized protein with GYD domain